MKESFIITAHYTLAADNHFDVDYYVKNHLPLVKRFDPDCLIQIDAHQIADPKKPGTASGLSQVIPSKD